MKPIHVIPSAALALAAMLTSCSGGSTGTGTATITLTDAANDELALFEVDVTNIVLHKVGGADVSVMAKRTRVDFASLDELAELFVGVGVETGFYSGLTMTLDFAGAEVWLNGKSTAATVLDASGSPLTGAVDVQVDFSTAARPMISVARNHLFVLDLDLDSALTIDSTDNQVTFVPVISAEVDPTNPKTVATTGYLMSADVVLQRFVVEKRAADGTALGQYTVQGASNTIYQVDGAVLPAALGFLALAAQANGQKRVFAQGTVDASSRLLRAQAVEEGAGTLGNGQDWVEGLIVARDNGAGSDAALTVLGTSRLDSSGARTFNTQHTVNVSLTSTKVLRRGAGSSLTSDALQVGQRVFAFGSLSGTTLDATATSGVVRMIRTSVFGTALAAPSANVLTLDVVRIGLRPIGDFDFTVGGVPQSDAANFTVDITGLSGTGIVTGSKIHAIGWLNPVGVTGDQDMTAVSITNRSTTLQLMLCAWVPPSAAAVSSAAASGITLDVSGAALEVVDDGFGTTTLSASPAPRVRPAALLGIYRIVQGNAIDLHLGFPSFAAALSTRLASASVARVAALGALSGSQVFDALGVTVVLR